MAQSNVHIKLTPATNNKMKPKQEFQDLIESIDLIIEAFRQMKKLLMLLL